jgi:hypothetical protein
MNAQFESRGEVWPRVFIGEICNEGSAASDALAAGNKNPEGLKAHFG